ncbi:unnamed protein product, partial [Adineta steineri]
MYLLSTYIFTFTVNAIVITEIHRSSLYYPLSSSAFLGNTTWSTDVSIQSCIWECVYENECQTAIYFNDEKTCSMFADYCQSGSIQSSGNIRASVICYRQNSATTSTSSSTDSSTSISTTTSTA